jgi:ABC-type glycerol-3-phosphate transport system substrate-binding protein
VKAKIREHHNNNNGGNSGGGTGTANPGQNDNDGDGQGNECEDTDYDGVPEAKDNSPQIRIQIKKILMMINLYPVFPCINPIDLFDDANIYVPGNNTHRSR